MSRVDEATQVVDSMESHTLEPEQVNLCRYCTDLSINRTAAQIDHWQTLALLRLSSTKCTICEILLDGFDKVAKAAMDRFKQITEATAEHCPLLLNLNSVSKMESEMAYKFIRAGIKFPNKFTYIWRFHIAARKSQGQYQTFTTFAIPNISRMEDLPDQPRNKSVKNKKLAEYLREQSYKLFRAVAMFTTGATNRSGYCWEGSAPVKTTKRTLASYQNEIPQSDLPKSFSDAALITRAIGLRYLWIDALCIIQDDQDDWATESSKMADIYHGSKLSVIANESTSSSGGVFTQDSSKLPEEATRGRRFLESVHIGNGKCANIHLVREQRYGPALDERGWTLQENVLSPRTIGVANSELKWRCGLGTRWETGINYVQGDGTYGNPPVLGKSPSAKDNRIWSRWMEDYSRRRLTFPEDRLVAMLGLVTHYQRITQDEPILGMWRSSLPEDLAWERDTDRSDRIPSKLADHNLPSWSPFACDQAISFEYGYGDDVGNEPGESCVDVIDRKVLWEGTPYLSKVQSSFLMIEGSVREIYLSEATKVPECKPPYFDLDDEVGNTDDGPLPWRCAVQWDLEGYRLPQKWPCLLLRRKPTKEAGEFGREIFLVLEKVTGQTYRRVGIGSLKFKHNPGGPAEQGSKFNPTDRSRITLV